MMAKAATRAQPSSATPDARGRRPDPAPARAGGRRGCGGAPAVRPAGGLPPPPPMSTAGRPPTRAKASRNNHPSPNRSLSSKGTPAAHPRGRSACPAHCPSAPSSDSSRTTPTAPAWPAKAAARSCRCRCGRTSSPRCSTASTTRWPPDGPRSWSRATTARRRTSPPTCAPGCTPRAVRFYPSRGVAYESHLAPPPHLVGLRVAALDALLEAPEPPVVVVSAVALSEKVPDPALRPHAFTLRKGDLIDLEETALAARRRPATSASTRSTSAASSRSAAASSTSTRRPRITPSASTCSTSRSSRCATSRRSRSARSTTSRRSRSRPPPSSRRSTASWPRSPRSATPRTARTSPSSCRSTVSTRCWTSRRPTRRC